jgi:nucleotide-binding universal stress UspA family protein
MEGGLPERYRREDEMERQRVVHDELITRGLNIISDSYHDAASAACEAAGVAFRRLSPEGKNYRRIVEAAASGEFDLLALGALGLGAVAGSVLGTVCERVVRRCPIDVLVIKDPARAIGEGPLVAALDGSPRSFGALKAALQMGRALGAEVHAVAAYDPYFHTVAFNKISGALSEEAARQFRFEEQEKLHEEIIDSGIAKIYQSHLELARSLAADEGGELACELLEGKPYQVIAEYLSRVNASLVLVGKTGIHADPGLDIGGNAENLLRTAACHIWLGQSSHTPPIEAVARETISWTDEAEQKMTRVPETAREMVRMAIIRFAQESGHTVVTTALIDEATRRFCPDRGGAMDPGETLRWSQEASALLDDVADTALAATIRLRAEKRARRERAATVTPDHVRPFLDSEAAPAPTWTAEAETRMERVPDGFMRTMTRRRVEAFARRHGVTTITRELIDEKYSEWGAGSAKQKTSLEWADSALDRVTRIPDFVRGMVIVEIERCARAMGRERVTDAVIDRARTVWRKAESFHSETDPALYK